MIGNIFRKLLTELGIQTDDADRNLMVSYKSKTTGLQYKCTCMMA